MFPKLFASKPEIFGGDVGLVVKHAFLPGVGLTGGVDVHAAVVSGELVHQFAENGKVADDTGVIFKQDFSVFENPKILGNPKCGIKQMVFRRILFMTFSDETILLKTFVLDNI